MWDLDVVYVTDVVCEGDTLAVTVTEGVNVVDCVRLCVDAAVDEAVKEGVAENEGVNDDVKVSDGVSLGVSLGVSASMSKGSGSVVVSLRVSVNVPLMGSDDGNTSLPMYAVVLASESSPMLWFWGISSGYGCSCAQGNKIAQLKPPGSADRATVIDEQYGIAFRSALMNVDSSVLYGNERGVMCVPVRYTVKLPELKPVMLMRCSSKR